MTEHTLIFGNYIAEKTDEGMLIHDVELSRETSKADRPDFLRDLNTKTFEQFKVHYDARVAADKVGAFILLNSYRFISHTHEIGEASEADKAGHLNEEDEE